MFPISSKTPLWVAAGKLLGTQGEEFFLRWSQVARGFGAADIHDLRVDSRRLREGLALFAPCYPEKALSRIGRQVKRVTVILGLLRNIDESILFFLALRPEERRQSDLEIRELLVHLEKERKAARGKLEGDLGALKPGPLKTSLNTALHHPKMFGNDRVDPFMDLSRFADAAITSRAQPLGELLPLALDGANFAAQHQLRIAFKRVRYRLEILAPIFGSDYPELQRALKEYQEVLGKLHDLDVFAELVRDRIPEGDGRENLLRTLAGRRGRLHCSLVFKLEGFSVDAMEAKTRSSF